MFVRSPLTSRSGWLKGPKRKLFSFCKDMMLLQTDRQTDDSSRLDGTIWGVWTSLCCISAEASVKLAEMTLITVAPLRVILSALAERYDMVLSLSLVMIYVSSVKHFSSISHCIFHVTQNYGQDILSSDAFFSVRIRLGILSCISWFY